MQDRRGHTGVSPTEGNQDDYGTGTSLYKERRSILDFSTWRRLGAISLLPSATHQKDVEKMATDSLWRYNGKRPSIPCYNKDNVD